MGGAIGFFDAWARLMLRHRLAVLVLVGAITAAFAWSLTRLPMLTSLADVVPKDDAWEIYRDTRDRFGSDEVVLVGVVRDDHFTPAGLARLEAFAAAVEEHALVEEVVAFTRADHLFVDPAEPGRLRIEPFYDADEPQDPAAVRAAVLGDDLIRGDLVSADGRVALVVVRLVPAEDRVWSREAVAAYVQPRLASMPGGEAQLDMPGGKARAIEVARQQIGAELLAIAAQAGYGPDDTHLSGFPVVFGSLLHESEQVVGRYLPLCGLLLALALFAMFRRVMDVALPLICMAPAVIWAIGTGGLIFGRLTIITSVAPVMVLVVGMSDVVHLLTQFHHELGRGHPRHEAIRVAFREVGVACTLTSLTTLIGFGSMALLPLPHARELGVFAALGVVAAFVLAFVLTPVLLSFTRPGEVRPPSGVLTRFLDRLAQWLRPRPRTIVAVGLGATILALAAVSQVHVENSLLLKLPPDHPLRRSAEVVREAVEGNGETELIIDTGRDEGVKDAALLAAVGRFTAALDALPEAGRVRSVADVLGRMHRLLAPERGEALPTTREQIAQYLLLFEMSGGQGLAQLVDAGGRTLRVTIRMPYLSAERAIELADRVEALAAEHLPPDVRTHVTGMAMLAARAGPVILSTSLKGLAGAVVLIALVMGLLFGSVRVAVLSIVPNVLPVALGLATVWLTLPQVDADTMVYLTICIGIAVDDTIHFLARFRLERAKGLGRADAVEATLRETGHGILRTSLILIAGFVVMLASDYLGLQTLGLILPGTLAFAVVLDLTMVPAMAQLGLLEPRLRGVSRAAGPESPTP
ncbi:MAG: MMPL family transporter [Myxococcales bacterium]|nr:MMPL family transporter [Myxococcales bacterium]